MAAAHAFGALVRYRFKRIGYVRRIKVNFLEPSGPLQACKGTGLLFFMYFASPGVVQAKAQFCSSSIAGIASSNPAKSMDVRLLCVCCVGGSV